MNAEIIKAMNRKEKNHPIRNWWSKNGYKVIRVVLWPLWLYEVASTKIRTKLNAKQEWSKERAHEILSYYIPRRANWDAEDQTFYFFDNGYGWSMSHAKKCLKRKDRRWWNVHRGWCGGEIRNYLINEFELEGFTKEVGCCEDSWTEISFEMIGERA